MPRPIDHTTESAVTIRLPREVFLELRAQMGLRELHWDAVAQEAFALWLAQKSTEAKKTKQKAHSKAAFIALVANDAVRAVASRGGR